jgi:hypothetical protein
MWRTQRRCTVGEVLNLSEGGMLVTGSGLRVGELTHVEVTGPRFRFAAYAEVAHVSDEAIGLHLIGWRGAAAPPLLQSLIAERTQERRFITVVAPIPGEYLG